MWLLFDMVSSTNPSIEKDMPSPAREPNTGPVSVSLRKGASWIVLGNLLNAASQWGMLAILAKVGGPLLVGEFTLGLAITTPIMVFFSFQLRQVLATDASNRHSFSQYFGSRLLWSILAFGILTILSYSLGYRDSILAVIILVGLLKINDALFDIIYGLWQKREEMALLAQVNAGTGVARLAAFGVTCIVSRSLIVSLIVANVVGLIYLGVVVTMSVYRSRGEGERLKWSRFIQKLILWPNWQVQRELLFLTLPLGISAALAALGANAPRYVIERFMNTNDLGIYAALAYALVAAKTVVIAVGAAVSPKLARFHYDGDYVGYRALLFKFLLIGVFISVLATTLVSIAGQQLLAFLYSSDFASHADLLLLLTVSAGFEIAGWILCQGLIVVRRMKIQAVIEIACVIMSIVACLAFVSKYGLIGVGVAAMLSSLLRLSAATIVSYQYMVQWRDAPSLAVAKQNTMNREK